MTNQAEKPNTKLDSLSDEAKERLVAEVIDAAIERIFELQPSAWPVEWQNDHETRNGHEVLKALADLVFDWPGTEKDKVWGITLPWIWEDENHDRRYDF